MPRFRITGPDGRNYEVNAPEGATQADVLAYVQQQAGQQAPSPQQRAMDATRAQQDAERIGEMSWPEKLAVGVGRGFNDIGQGVKQLGLQAGEALGLADEGRAAEYTHQVGDELAAYETLRKDSPYLTGGGRIVGNIAALPIPGGAGGTMAARIGTSALAGAAQGGLRFAGEGESRLENAAIGGTVGALMPPAIAGVLKAGKVTTGAVKKAADWLAKAMPNMTRAQQERAAAQMIREAAANPAALTRAANPQQFVAGTQQTLAEATDDVGMAGLQRTLQSMNPEFNNRVSQIAGANNTARVEALRQGFGGADEASAVAIEQARNQATQPLLDAARKVKGVDTKPTLRLADRILRAREGNDTVTGIIQRVRDILGREGMDDVQRLHNARQEIGNILGGLSPAQQSGKAASRELLAIRQSLDTQIGKASPEFRQFLRQFADMSKDAGRVRMGQELLGKSAASLDASGNPVLMPAQFARAADDLDRVAKAATGFRKESAARLMTPEQQALVGNVRADLDRVARLSQGKAIGSNTAQNAAGMARVQDTMLGGDSATKLLPRIADAIPIINSMRRHFGNKTMEVVQDMMTNPQAAAQILARFPPAQRAQVQSLFSDPRFLEVLQGLQVAGPAPVAAAFVGAPNAPRGPQQP